MIKNWCFSETIENGSKDYIKELSDSSGIIKLDFKFEGAGKQLKNTNVDQSVDGRFPNWVYVYTEKCESELEESDKKKKEKQPEEKESKKDKTTANVKRTHSG